MQDYPAAHSMDTTWFAIDADENVAVFDSGEGGAVPESFKPKFFDIYFVDAFIELFAKDDSDLVKIPTPAQSVLDKMDRSEFIKDVKNALSEEEYYLQRNHNELAGIEPDLFPDYKLRLRNTLLTLNSKSSISQLQENTSGRIVQFSGEPLVVYVEGLIIPSKAMAMIESGDILAGRRFSLNTTPKRIPPHWLGAFSYHCDLGSAIPYTRQGCPSIPLKLHDLSADLQDWLSLTWFDKVQFEKTKLLQPIEYEACRTWSVHESWLDSKLRDQNSFDLGIEWFATDRAGHLAVFHSLTRDVVPESIQKANSGREQGLQRLFNLLPAQADGTVHLPIAAKTVCGGVTLDPTEECLPSIFEYVGFATELLLILSMQEYIPLLKEEADLVIRFEGELAVVWCDRLPLKMVKNMIDSRQIIGLKIFPLHRENSALLGVYSYDYDQESHENQQQAGYRRTSVAACPLTLEALSATVPVTAKEGLSQVMTQDGVLNFNVTPFPKISFAQATFIHPCDPNLIESWVGWST